MLAYVPGQRRSVVVSKRTGRPNLDLNNDQALIATSVDSSNGGLRSLMQIKA